MAPGAQINMSQTTNNNAPSSATESNPFPRAAGTAGDFGASDVPTNGAGANVRQCF